MENFAKKLKIISNVENECPTSKKKIAKILPKINLYHNSNHFISIHLRNNLLAKTVYFCFQNQL